MTDFSNLPQMNAVAPQSEELWLKFPTWRAFFAAVATAVILLSECVSVLVIGGLLWKEASYIRGCRFPFYNPHDVYRLALILVGWNSFVWGCCVVCGSRNRRTAKLAALVSIILWIGFVAGIEIGRSLPLDDELRLLHVPQP